MRYTNIYLPKTVFKSKLLPVRTNLTLYKIVIFTIALYFWETCATTEVDETCLEIFKRITLHKYLALRKSITWKNINEALIRNIKMVEDPEIIAKIKCWKINWSDHLE
jgi:hypothetical protein